MEHIAVVDRSSLKVVTTWRVAMARSNFPMALDEANHRLFIGCRQPARALVFDTSTGTEIASFDIAGDTDDLFYDAARQRLYVSRGEGYVTSSRITAEITSHGPRTCRPPLVRARRCTCRTRAVFIWPCRIAAPSKPRSGYSKHIDRQ
jgi:hypothetical protein